MPGFSTFTRKEDLSLRLRAQHLKNAKDQTKRLEEDNRKMEERLKELKTAMKREKEQRERYGAGFWARGQPSTGSLTNYASEVLQNNAVIPPMDGKIKKVKVLRDEPVEKPKLIGPPGTMKYIAQRKLTTGTNSRDKQKGPKCGQCEDRTATVSCVQCSEIYCPGCFAAFHLKGALKQHRSVPLSAAGPRICVPQSTSVDSSLLRGGQASGSLPTEANNDVNDFDAAGASSATSPQRNPATTLLQGDYSESQSAASFQAALLAWRQGEQPNDHQSVRQHPEKKVTSPAMTVDESIGTSEQSKVPDITFKSTLSYAEKLMLKKHLRMKLAEVSPDVGTQSCLNLHSQTEFASETSREVLLRSSSQLHSQGLFYEGNALTDLSRAEGNLTTDSMENIRKTVEDFSGNMENSATDSNEDLENRKRSSIDEDDCVDFRSLFDAVTLSESPDRLGIRSGPSRSNVSIIEMFLQEPSGSDMPNQRSTVAYTVKEVSPLESWKTEHLQQSEISASVDKNSRDKAQDIYIYHHSHTEKMIERKNPARILPSTSTTRASNSSHDHNCQSYPTISELPDDDSESLSRKHKSESLEHHLQDAINDLEGQGSPVSQAVGSVKPVSKPKSARCRPRSAKSSLSKSSRASSRTGYQGHLTKAPSESLRIVAQMARTSEYTHATQSPLESFFLLGVEDQQPSEMESGVLTASKGKNKTSRPESRSEVPKSARQEKESVKISNRLYQMAPRSWHPENSLSSSVVHNEIKPDGQGEEVTISYSYSKQINGQGIKWCPSSSQNMKNKSGCDLSSNSDHVLHNATLITEATSVEPITCVELVQRSPGLSEGRIFPEPSRIDDNVLPLHSHQTSKKNSALRIHNILTPVSGGDPFKGVKIKPVTPDSRQSHRSEVSSSILARSKQSTNANSTEWNQKSAKLQFSKGEESIKQPRKSTESFNISLNKSTKLKPESSNSRIGQSESALRPHASRVQGEQNKTDHNKVRSSKTGVSLQNQGQAYIRRDFKNVLGHSKSDLKSDHRPNSSTTLTERSEFQRSQKCIGTPRPNSSSGGKEVLTKIQPCLQSNADTVVTDMMKARIHEDGWIDEDVDFSNVYDDGDDLTPVGLHMRITTKQNNKNSDKWETEVRPFSGLNLSSITGQSKHKVPSAKGDNVITSGSRSYRPLSAMSQKSGRLSRAVVVDGNDLSCYDNLRTPDEQNLEDKQALDQLEWELASSTGRLTTDGKISRMSILASDEPPMMRSLQIKSEKEYDIAAKLIEDEKQAERNVETLDMRRNVAVEEVDEVRALR